MYLKGDELDFKDNHKYVIEGYNNTTKVINKIKTLMLNYRNTDDMKTILSIKKNVDNGLQYLHHILKLTIAPTIKNEIDNEIKTLKRYNKQLNLTIYGYKKIKLKLDTMDKGAWKKGEKIRNEDYMRGYRRLSQGSIVASEYKTRFWILIGYRSREYEMRGREDGANGKEYRDIYGKVITEIENLEHIDHKHIEIIKDKYRKGYYYGTYIKKGFDANIGAIIPNKEELNDDSKLYKIPIETLIHGFGIGRYRKGLHDGKNHQKSEDKRTKGNKHYEKGFLAGKQAKEQAEKQAKEQAKRRSRYGSKRKSIRQR